MNIGLFKGVFSAGRDGPTPGEQWRMRETCGDPFPRKSYDPVEVLEVWQGWVRYKMGRIFSDERMPVKEFVSIYERVG